MKRFLKENTSLIILLLIFIALLIYEPLIFQYDNLVNIAKEASLIALFALAETIVLYIKGLDLSQGGTITIVSVSMALLSTHLGLPLAVILVIILGIVIGLVNGFIVSKLELPPFVVTLGIGFLLQGIALVLSDGQPVYKVSANFTTLGWGQIFGIPIVIYVLVSVFLILYIYINRTIYGRYLLAIGSNEKAALLSGIDVVKHKVIAYVICGMITAIGGVILASKINCGHPVEGYDTALQSVAAAVIGGVSLFGGKGSLFGVLLGAILLAFISNALNIINISSYYQQIMIGIIIILAVVIDRYKVKKA